MRPRTLITGAAVSAVAAAGVAVALPGGAEVAPAGASPVATSSATVARTTLVERETVAGRIGFAAAERVLHRLAGDGGTITRVAAAGSTIRRGSVLYRVDAQPVVAMYGGTAAYRTLAVGAGDGADVRQLERNLAALGYDPGTVDRHFDGSTAAAVRRWQDDVGLPETGQVELGRVVFVDGRRRVGERKVTAGSPVAAGAEILELTSSRRVVDVELDAAKQALVRAGETATVTLPDGSTATGRVVRVSRVARAKAGTSGEESQEAVVDVRIALRGNPRGARRLDRAPVSVGISREVREDVLAVPVTALLAQVGGGYAVQVRDGSGVRTVPVQTGMFANGLVEITGAVEEGDRVVVPR